MLCMLSPMSSLKTKCATRLLRETFHTRGIGNDNKSISIARLGRLGSGSETIGSINDFIFKLYEALATETILICVT